jgi:transposase
MLVSMRPTGTAQQLEKRRRLAIGMLNAGRPAATVARAVSASRSSVHRWQATYRQDGWSGLKSQPAPGRPARLSGQQRDRLADLLLQGALSAGYATDLWTLARIGQMIRKHFQVRYHPGHVWRILQAMGWSSQKPERRPVQRDEAAIRRWQRYRWPRLKKSPGPGGALGFYR